MVNSKEFKARLKELLPEGEMSMVHHRHVIVHNSKGGLDPKMRFINKIRFSNWPSWGNEWGLGNVTTRTDLNYQDNEYLAMIERIVNQAWEETRPKDE